MTTTAILAAQSVGGSAGVVGAVKTTLQAATTSYVLSAEVTNGNGVPSPLPKTVRFYYTTSPWSYTAAQGAARLQQTARYIDLPIPDAGGGILAKDATIEVRTGDYLYTWIETEGFANPLTVNASLLEF